MVQCLLCEALAAMQPAIAGPLSVRVTCAWLLRIPPERVDVWLPRESGCLASPYVYNALDQRIGVNDSGGGQTWTIFNGPDPDALPYADFNGSGTLLTRYVSGPGMVNGAVVDELLARTSSGGTTAWYLTDKLDSVRDVVSSAGSVLDHVVYDGFGNITTETNASNGDRFRFAGMAYDPTTGQYYDHARNYEGITGRFFSQDPSSFAGDDADMYRYAGNSPADGTDFTGLFDDSQLPMPPIPSKTLPLQVAPVTPKLDTEVQQAQIPRGSAPVGHGRRQTPPVDGTLEPVLEGSVTYAPTLGPNPALFNDPGQDMTGRERTERDI